MNEAEITLVWCTFPDEATADRIARMLIEEGLCACANRLPAVTSIYRWQGEIEQANEVAALFKCADGPAAAGRIAELHPYDLPAIELWPARCSADLAKWVRG